MSSKTIAENILLSYERAVVWGKNDNTEAALQEAVNAAIPLNSDHDKAELYARLADNFFEKPAGVIRRMYVRSTVEAWRIARVHGPAIAAAKAAAVKPAPKKGTKA